MAPWHRLSGQIWADPSRQNASTESNGTKKLLNSLLGFDAENARGNFLYLAAGD